jgi:hypothetical protein
MDFEPVLVPKYCGRVPAVDFYCQMLLNQMPSWQYLQKELLFKYLCCFNCQLCSFALATSSCTLLFRSWFHVLKYLYLTTWVVIWSY